MLRFINEVQDARSTDPINELFSPELINHTAPSGTPHSLEAMTETLQSFFDAFPDLSVEVELQIAEGDLVSTRKRFRGTHLGDFRGMPASGNRVDFAVMEFMEVKNGKIVGHWGLVDGRAMLDQIEGANR